MQNILFCFVLFCFLDTAAAEKQKIVFFRPAKIGSLLTCRLSAVTSVKSTTLFTNSATSERVNNRSREITIEGILKIITVNKNGHALKIEFTVSSVKGKIKKKPFIADWNGKTIIVDMNIKPICKFRIKGSDAKLTHTQINMLSLLFKPAPDENIADYIGTDKAVGIGDSWKAPTAPFINFFRKQGLILPQDHIKGSVSLKSHKKFESIDCWEIKEKLEIFDLPGFTFFFSLSILLPTDGVTGNLTMTRKAFEKFEKTPGSKHPMASGIKKITLEMKDTFTAVMVPIRSGSEAKKYSGQH